MADIYPFILTLVVFNDTCNSDSCNHSSPTLGTLCKCKAHRSRYLHLLGRHEWLLSCPNTWTCLTPCWRLDSNQTQQRLLEKHIPTYWYSHVLDISQPRDDDCVLLGLAGAFICRTLCTLIVKRLSISIDYKYMPIITEKSGHRIPVLNRCLSILQTWQKGATPGMHAIKDFPQH